MTTGGAREAAFEFNSEKTFSSVIHVDKYGFWLNQDPKIMFLFCWMSDLPALYGGPAAVGPAFGLPSSVPRLSIDYGASGRFNVSTTDGKKIFEGVYRKVRRDESVAYSPGRDYPGEYISIIDVTPVNVPGEYFVWIEGVGRGLPFKVRPVSDFLKYDLKNY